MQPVTTPSRLPTSGAEQILNSAQPLCSYLNATSQLQVVRLISTDPAFERVVFPYQRLLFESSPRAELEVQVDSSGRARQISCDRLRVRESA